MTIIFMRFPTIAALGVALASACWSETVCNVKRISDILKKPNCKWLHLDAPPKVMQHPEFYKFIKKIPAYELFSLKHTHLVNITDLTTIKLKNGSSVIITNNDKLEKLPDFEWNKDDLVHFFISDNPKLDTAVLREKISKSKVLANTFVQEPFACGHERTTSCGCRIIEDDVVIGLEKNEDLESVVEIHGSLRIVNTSLEELPEMPKLRKIIQKNRPGFPTLIIQDNPELASIQSISYVDDVVNDDPKKAVVIKNNPKLCIKLEDEDAPFVLSYADDVRRCPSDQFQ
ncbi:hypothetical protein Aduo_010818 [Ancylostoma duodenale]